LGTILELAYGKPLKAENRTIGTIAVFGSNGQVGWHDKMLVSGPGIVVGRKGNPGIVKWAHSNFYPIDTTFYVQTKEACQSLYFLFHALSNLNLANLSADSAVPGLNRNQAYMSNLIIPVASLLEMFDQKMSSIFAMIHANEVQCRTLSSIRDSLISKLLVRE
jgi:type I restriction enzyme S subunit